MVTPALFPDPDDPTSVPTSVDVPVLDVSRKWNHTHPVCPCVSGFSTECCMFKVHPHCGECQRLPHFHGRVILPRVDGHVHPSFTDGRLGCLPLSAIVACAAVTTGVS